MKASTTPVQRAASIAALLDDGSDNYWEQGAAPSDPPVLVKPHWRLLGRMVTGYVRHYHPTICKKRHKELRAMVREEWLGEIPDLPGTEYSSETDINISDLQCGFEPERLPCWAWEMGTEQPFAEPVDSDNAEKFGSDYIALNDAPDPQERLSRLLQWAEGLHPVECHADTQGPKAFVPDYVGPANPELSASNYHAMLRGERTYLPLGSGE